jgi:hypothetical protein
LSKKVEKMRRNILIGIFLALLGMAVSGCSDFGGDNSLEPYEHELHIDLDESDILDDTDAISSTPPEQFTGLFVSRVLYESDREDAQRSLKLSSRNVSRDPLTVLYDISEDAELWLMPTVRRSSKEISFENTWNIKKYSTEEDGSFLIPHEDLPNSTFVIFVMNIPDGGNPEVIGFMSLEAEGGDPVIEFPPAEKLKGVITFGYVSLDDADYYGQSQMNLADNEEAFTPEVFEQLSKDVIIHNAALMALNVLWNTDDRIYYSPSMGISYGHQKDAQVQDSSDVRWRDAEIRIYSHDTTSQVGLFRPDGEQVGDFVTSYGNSSVKWAFSISMDELNAYATPRNIWQLRKNDPQRTIIALFDLSVAIITDSLGNPIIPLIDPAITTITDGETIETLDMNWYYFGKDGTTRHTLTDAEQLDRLLKKSEFWFQGFSAEDDYYETYMFREAGNQGLGGMIGDLIQITDISPALQETEFFDSMGYSFGLYGVEVRNER